MFIMFTNNITNTNYQINNIPKEYVLIFIIILYIIRTINDLIIFRKYINSYIDIKRIKQKNKISTKFQYLLQSPNNYEFNPNYLDLVTYDSSPLIKCLDDFCRDNSLYKNAIIVSLSGGVDSMVILAILIFLQKQKIHNFKIYTASIDYGLREESNDESNFLIEYTEMLGIKSYVSYVKGVSRKKNDSCSRSEFEEESRNLRFNTYKTIIEENKLAEDTGVFVAHHLDDIVENIFTNSMRGANLMDLEVMRSSSVIHDVKILRPFIGFKKQYIYDFAHKFGIPYFLDTTPKWSKRGLMRNEIFPLLDSVFGIDWRNKLKQLGTQSNEWGSYVDKYVIDPWFLEIKKGTAGVIIPLKNQPIHIYSNVIMKSLHSIRQSMLKRTSIDRINILINTATKTKTKTNLVTDGTRICTLIESNKLLIIDTSLITNSINNIGLPNLDNDNYEQLINGNYYSNMSNIPNNIKKLFK